MGYIYSQSRYDPNSRNQEIDKTEQMRLYWCLDLMCRVNTFLVFPDQVHSGQLKPSREDDAGALETEVEGKGSVADPAAAKLTFVSLEHLDKFILPKKVNSPFVELFHVLSKVLVVDKGLLALVAEE